MITKEQLIEFRNNCVAVSGIQHDVIHPDHVAIAADGSVYVIEINYNDPDGKYELDFDMIYTDIDELLKQKRETRIRKKDAGNELRLQSEKEKDMKELKRLMDKYDIKNDE